MERRSADTWRTVSDRTKRRRVQRDLAALRASPEYRWLRRKEEAECSSDLNTSSVAER